MALLPTPDGCVLNVRLTPGASHNRVGPLVRRGRHTYLNAHITQVPEKGKANTELCRLLAKTFKVPKSCVEITTGQTHRNKSILFKNQQEAKLLPILNELSEQQTKV
tara:strand:+ start:617 stop:937 length:321 start_codon:yes stop_codon:yes gene_type:complete